MTLEQLKTLQAVVQCGTINDAAKILFKTQPAVSMTLKKMEEQLGFTLFDRHQYRLKLTDKGRIYYQKSKLILAQLEQLSNLATSFTRGEEHQVTIAIEGLVDKSALMDKLVPIQSGFPHTELHLNAVYLLNSLNMLREKQVTLAITPWLPLFDAEGDFESKCIDTFEFQLCIHKQLLKKHNPEDLPITPELLAEIPQLVPSDFAMNIDNTAMFRHVSKSLVKINDNNVFFDALNAQLGWGPITDAVWDKQMEKSFIRFRMPSVLADIKGEIRAVKNRADILGPAAQAIWDCL